MNPAFAAHPGEVTRPDEPPGHKRAWSEFVVVLLLAVLGIFVLVEASTINNALARHGSLGPQAIPRLVGAMLLAVSVLLAIDIARGGHGESEGGEDVDLTLGTDWKTLGGLVVVFGVSGQLIPRLGMPIAGAILFFGVSRLLGSRHLRRDLGVALLVPLLAYLLFTRGLGVSLPAGLLESVI